MVPVSVVERWRGELGGSLYGISAATNGRLGFRPACEFFSIRSDWELRALNISFPTMATVGLTAGPDWYQIFCHLFTPFGGYVPTETDTVGFFGPQLITSTPFTQGTVRGQAGVNAVNAPFGIGWCLSANSQRVGQQGSGIVDQDGDATHRSYLEGGLRLPLGEDKKLQNTITFDPPIRVRRNRIITVQLIGADATFSYNPLHSLLVCALYNEMPNPRGSFQT